MMNGLIVITYQMHSLARRTLGERYFFLSHSLFVFYLFHLEMRHRSGLCASLRRGCPFDLSPIFSLSFSPIPISPSFLTFPRFSPPFLSFLPLFSHFHDFLPFFSPFSLHVFFTVCVDEMSGSDNSVVTLYAIILVTHVFTYIVTPSLMYSMSN
jgi:hypothetical protein